MRTSISVLRLVLLLASLAGAAEGAGLRRDIAYDDGSDPARRLDVSTPDGAGPFPVVILVHGGGWSSGDKGEGVKPGSGADIRPWFEPLTEAGFVWVSINNRLAPANRWPACLDDTRAAVEWTRAHIADYGGDPARMAIMGHSAGGHLALFAATPAEAGGVAPVRAVVGCAAVSDLVSDTERRGGPSASLRMLFDLPEGAGSPEIMARLGEVSPVRLVAAGYPPTLLLHGDADKTVPLAQSQAFQARLRELGVDCDLHVLPGAGHRLSEWAARDPEWTRVLTDWLHARLVPAAKLVPVAAQQ
jgi:acetyl esterase/lipase